MPLTTVIASLPKKWQVSVYDNSIQAADLGVYGRYQAIRNATTDVVFVQDDDCLLPPETFEKLQAAYMPGALTANMPSPFRQHYSDSCLVGFGAIFDRDLVFAAFNQLPSLPPDFHRTCDVYFTALTENHVWLDLPYKNLRWATAEDRMYREKDHVGSRAEALRHARSLRDH